MMEKIIILLLIIGCIALSIMAIINTLRLHQLREKNKRKFYRTPKLSDLKGKEFSDYIDDLTSELH